MRTGRRTRWLIWIFAIFVVTLTWLAPVQRYRFERNEAIQNAMAQNSNRAIMLEQYVTRTLEAADIATLHIDERLSNPGDEILRGTAARPAVIHGPIAENRSFLGISVVDPQGDLIASTLRAVRPRNVRDHEAFQAHLRRRIDGLYVSRPSFSSTFGGQVIWLTRRVDNEDGSLRAIIAVNLAPQQLIGFSEGVAVKSTDVISIVGLDGITRARRAGARASAGEDVSGGVVMRPQRLTPYGSYLGPSSIDGLVRYFSHRRLRDYPLFATYGVLQDEVLGPVRRRARLFALVATLVTLITIGFATALVWLLDRRDRSALEIAEANRRLEEAQTIARIGDWSFDFATQEVKWSPPMFEMYERDPAKGPPTMAEFSDYLDQDSKTVIGQAIAHGSESGTPRAYELTVILPSGARGHRLVHAIPRLDEQGNVVGLFGTDQDIGERKKVDQLEAAVAHLSRLEAMNAMASTLAHELNQPLTAASNYLVGTSRMMEGGDADPQQTAEGVRAAREQVQFAGEIIRRVRAMVANEPRRMAPVSVSRIIDDAVSLSSLGSEEATPATIERRIAPDARVIVADHVQIEQVLLNLFRNARDAARPGTDLVIHITSRRHGSGQVAISVEDNGAGFDQADASVFSAFASSRAAGLGLGLSISRTIVEAHGGRIWVENRDGGGARVCFTVPASDSEEAPGSAERRAG